MMAATEKIKFAWDAVKATDNLHGDIVEVGGSPGVTRNFPARLNTVVHCDYADWRNNDAARVSNCFCLTREFCSVHLSS